MDQQGERGARGVGGGHKPKISRGGTEKGFAYLLKITYFPVLPYKQTYSKRTLNPVLYQEENQSGDVK